MPAGSRKFYRGQLLLDSGQLTGSFFHRAVVLICQHDAQGAFGLILNRPTDKKVGSQLTVDLPKALKKLPLHLGGPVQTSALSYLHSDALLPDANVMPSLSMGHALENLVQIGESLTDTSKIRMFAGYAGWSANQLEGEIERGAWVIEPATLDLVFAEDLDNLWRHILKQRQEWNYKLLAESPEDLSWN